MNKTASFLKPYYIQVVLSAFFLMVAAVATICFAFFLGGMVDAAINQDLSTFKRMVFFSITSMGIELCFEVIGHTIRHNYSYKAAIQYKKSLLNKILSLGINSFSNHSEAYYLNVVSDEAKIIKEHYFMQFPAIIHNAIQILLAIGALVFINWKFFCVVVVLFAISSTFPNRMGVIQGEKTIIASEKNENFLSYLNSALGAFELIKTFGIIEQIIKTFSGYCTDGEKSNYSVEIFETIRNVLSAASSFIIQMGAILTGVILVFDGELSIGYLFVGVQVIGVIISPITDIFQRLSWVKSTTEIRKKHEGIFNLEENNKPGDEVVIEKIDDLKALDLSFNYSDGFEVRNINLDLYTGGKYAIIGSSGSGKTTLIKLILGYFDNYRGSIKVNGIELKDIDKNAYYKQLSVMSQNVVLFEDTLDNNIKLFREVDDKKYAEVISKANLNILTERFHKKNEIVSCNNISDISGGERQRIAIARCLLSNADVIVFDEATASLDPENAQVIYDMVLEMSDKMLIAVTHDWSDELLCRFDQVLYISDGTVKYAGKWDEIKEFLRGLQGKSN